MEREGQYVETGVRSRTPWYANCSGYPWTSLRYDGAGMIFTCAGTGAEKVHSRSKIPTALFSRHWGHRGSLEEVFTKYLFQLLGKGPHVYGSAEGRTSAGPFTQIFGGERLTIFRSIRCQHKQSRLYWECGYTCSRIPRRWLTKAPGNNNKERPNVVYWLEGQKDSVYNIFIKLYIIWCWRYQLSNICI